MNTQSITNAFTHGGKFHADDVFSAALLTLLFPNIQIERGFTVPENFDGIVFDIGFGKFDHHQQDKEIRDNGIAYAAFGLLWKEYGTCFLSEEEAKKFDEEFIQPLDISDNTGEPNEIASIISLFNPGWDETLDTDICFEQAKNVAMQILERKFAYIKGETKAYSIVKDAIEKAQDHILILDYFVPWKKNVVDTSIYFVIYPSKRGGYNAQAVPASHESPELKYPFLEEWRGVDSEQLPAISGIETLHFCHTSGFLIATDTLEDAKRACMMVLKKNEVE